MEIALIENLQREDLTPWEEALGYQTLIDTYGFTQEEVAKSMGKSRPAITNSLRLLQLPGSVVDFLKNGDISAGHARALLSLKDEKIMLQLSTSLLNEYAAFAGLVDGSLKASRPPAELFLQYFSYSL